MSASSPAIAAAGLGRDYGSVRALDALDLEVPRGSLVGLLGPNGSGKTTTMLLLATLLRPSRGKVRLFGQDAAADRTELRRRLGLVFQEPSVDGLLTVEENLLFAARLVGLGGGAARRAVNDAIERMGLTEWASQPARQLSGGWRRVTDIARATLHQPELLILDEPTVGLDPEHRQRTWHLLESERRLRGTTLLFSTHYLTEAERCDSVVLLANGRTVAAGTPAALRKSFGDEVVEIEGPDAHGLLAALDDVVSVRMAITTERGYRVGISGPREGLAQLASTADGVTSFALRPTTLDDVYFARTRPGHATARSNSPERDVSWAP